MKLLAVFPHPDDETSVGPLLARYSAEGNEVNLICLTSGQQGVARTNLPPGDELGAIREDELRCAAAHLGIGEPVFYRFQDRQIPDQKVQYDIAVRLREYFNEARPDIVITWGPDGMTGHPDHWATCTLVTQVFQQRAKLVRPPRKLYYVAYPESRFLNPPPPFESRPIFTVSDDLITTDIDCSAYLDRAERAIECHKTQWPPDFMQHVREFNRRALNGHVYLRLAFGALQRGERETALSVEQGRPDAARQQS